ncbi:MAG: cell division protein FtsA [Proteobacteria bacterium]|nr:cell division protein FtsA [Pseudomonadota bacterium]
MKKKLRLAAIDVGTTKVCCTIAEAGPKGDLEIIGMGVSPNRGTRRGAVVDIEEATQAIRSAVGEAEGQVGTTVQRCFLNLSGDFLTNLTSRGSVATSGQGRVIQESDVQRVTDNARMVGIPEDRRMLHVIPKGFSVDGLAGIKNPVGLSGLLLQVDTHIITASASKLQDFLTCLERADLELEENSGMVVSSVATSLGVLRDEEKELGVAMVDIGGGTTDLAVFKDGHLRHTDVLCVGGYHITYDVATALRVPMQEAERLVAEEGLAWKIDCASAAASKGLTPDDVDSDPSGELHIPEREIAVTSLSSVQPQPVRVSELSEIIDMRLMDIFDWLKAQINNLSRQGSRPASVVLTGGVAQMNGIAWVAERALDLPVRVASPEAIQGLPPHLRNPAYSAGIGLLVYGLGVMKGKPQETRTSQVNKVFQNFVTWLREYVF